MGVHIDSDRSQRLRNNILAHVLVKMTPAADGPHGETSGAYLTPWHSWKLLFHHFRPCC